ncbi:MAG: SDR family NAD(P)-dependent oxidoreductase [Rhodospirillales bacterium]|nr:SDR family NAD(P)-dependent oxidoreductase [Rhodospirillales bacterium]
MADSTLVDKVIIVTGAVQGLGKAIAEGLAENGAKLAICGLGGEKLQSVAAGIRTVHGDDRVLCRECDISDEAGTGNFVNEVVSRFGRIDALVNNAGLGCAAVRPDFMSNPVPIWQLDPAEWRRVVEVNTIGTFLMTRWAVPHMVAQGSGRLINVTTTFQTMLAPSFGAYGPSKAGIESMTSILVEELEGTGVTANVVVPGGPADTEQIPEGLVDDRDNLLRPDVMVPPIRWLCTDESGRVSGLRFAAALWDDDLPLEESLQRSTKPVAWRQLVEPLVTKDGVAVETSRGA